MIEFLFTNDINKLRYVIVYLSSTKDYKAFNTSPHLNYKIWSLDNRDFNEKILFKYINFLTSKCVMYFESQITTKITYKTKQNEPFVEDFMIKIVILLDMFLESVQITKHYIFG